MAEWSTSSSGYNGVNIYRGEDLLFTADTVGSCESDPYGYPYDGAEDDAKEIVTKLNLHDRLVECLKAAMAYIKATPCDPDITDEQLAAHHHLKSLSPETFIAEAEALDA